MDTYQKIAEFYQRICTDKRIIGKSFFGRDIYAVKIGDGRPIGIAQYAIHGREFITANLAMFHYERGVAKGSFWLVPMSNPDGCLLSEIGLLSVEREEDEKYLLSIHQGDKDFSMWKANGRGVDLNVNFDAKWGTGIKNIHLAGSENYIGEKPFSEKESVALKEFTEEIMPDYTLSYHTKGEEIYWRFLNSTRTCPRGFVLAQVISGATGYAIKDAFGSVGGYKDWCIDKYGIPSFTIEAGRDDFVHPLRENALEDILMKNKDVLFELSKSASIR
jgi:g-D-glutamyl-meso-diaminopimelate peptidase